MVRRIRETLDPSGKPLSISAFAAKYKLNKGLVSRWVLAGEIEVVKPSAFPGDTVRDSTTSQPTESAVVLSALLPNRWLDSVTQSRAATRRSHERATRSTGTIGL